LNTDVKFISTKLLKTLFLVPKANLIEMVTFWAIHFVRFHKVSHVFGGSWNVKKHYNCPEDKRETTACNSKVIKWHSENKEDNAAPQVMPWII
jgi:hypothetical protein